MSSYWDDDKKDWVPIATLVAERDRYVRLVVEIGDAMSPTGERPEEALGTLAEDVRSLVDRFHTAQDQRDQLGRALAGLIDEVCIEIGTPEYRERVLAEVERARAVRHKVRGDQA